MCEGWGTLSGAKNHPPKIIMNLDKVARLNLKLVISVCVCVCACGVCVCVWGGGVCYMHP